MSSTGCRPVMGAGDDPDEREVAFALHGRTIPDDQLKLDTTRGHTRWDRDLVDLVLMSVGRQAERRSQSLL